MSILNIAGYQFIALDNLSTLREAWLHRCQQLDLKGTILLSHEGINVNLAGKENDIRTFQGDIRSLFQAITFHESWSETRPFCHLKIKIKNEIITFRQPDADPIKQCAPEIAPALLKQWLDEKRDFTLLDTRNAYEVGFGSFTGALHLQLEDFGDLPDTLDRVIREKPVVMFCTGGIRCEKAALYMLERGFNEVYQLKGGILGYFQQVGGAHYEGECFVFDERISLNSDLKTSGTKQCEACQSPVTLDQQALPTYIPQVSCPTCNSV